MLIQKYLSLCPNPLNWNKQFWIKSRLTINESKTSWACAKRQLVFDFKTNSIFEFLSTQFHCITLYLDPNSELLWINIYRNLLFWNRFCSAKKVQTDLLLHCAERYPGSFCAERGSFCAERGSFCAERRSFCAERRSFCAEQRSFCAERRSFCAEQI